MTGENNSKMQAGQGRQTGFSKFAKWLPLVAILWSLSACGFIPQAKVVDVTTTDTVVPDSESILDYGYVVTAVIENLGAETARFNVETTLSSDEGEWKMNRDVLLDGHRRQAVKFLFKQPTITSQNVTPIVRVAPVF